MKTNSTVSTPVIAQLVVLGAIWGGAFTLIKVLVDDLSPLEMAAGRLTLGAAAVAGVLCLRRTFRWPQRDLILPIALVAALDTLVPYALVGWAESRIDSGAAAVLISAMPLFTVIFATVALRDEVISPARLTGVAIGFAGVLALMGHPSAFTESGALGQLAVIAGAASYAMGALRARALLKRIDAPNFTATKLLLGAVLASAATGIAGDGGGLVSIGASDAAALLTLGVVCTGIAFVLYFRVVAAIGSVGASTVTYIIPVFGLLFGVVALGESIEARTLAGMALIVSGVCVVMYAPWFESLVGGLRRRVRTSVGVIGARGAASS